MTQLPLTLSLALRYLRPHRTFVSVITIISVVGVMLGVMVLILVISVMSGFDHELRIKILGLNSHLTVTTNTRAPIQDWQQIRESIKKRPHIRGVAPFIITPAMVKFNGQTFITYVKGIDPILEQEVSHFAQYLKDGAFDLENDNLIIGSEMARSYGIFTGEEIHLILPKDIENKDALRWKPITGIFESGMFEYDMSFIFCSLKMIQDSLDLKNQVHGLAIMTDDLEHVMEVQKDLNTFLRPPLRANTWIELNRRLFSAIAVEKNMMFFLLIFIIIVAAFGIMSTLITVTVQKTREIGILKSIGATPNNVMMIFLTQGVVVGIIGTSLGLISGLTLLHYRNEFLDFLRVSTGFELFPRQIYNFDQLPAQTNLQDLVIICSSALVICTLAGLVPAWQAARLQPARALRDL